MCVLFNRIDWILPERWLLENWTRRSETALDWHPVATLSHTMAILLTQSAGNKNEYSKASHSFLSMKKGLSLSLSLSLHSLSSFLLCLLLSLYTHLLFTLHTHTLVSSHERPCMFALSYRANYLRISLYFIFIFWTSERSPTSDLWRPI